MAADPSVILPLYKLAHERVMLQLETANRKDRRLNVKDPLGDYLNLLDGKKMAFGQPEICSGIVEAGDVRKATVTAAFLTLTMRPQQVCDSSDIDGGKWSDLCSFSLLPSEKILSMMNEELNK